MNSVNIPPPETSQPAARLASGESHGRWLREHPVFPLLMICAGTALLSMALLIARYAMTGKARLTFLPANLILAFLPLLFLLLLERARRPGHIALCAVLWLLFFPNAPYMLTDLVHFDKRLGPVSWLDLLALLSAAWAALLGGMITLRFMECRVRARLPGARGAAFVPCVLLLTAAGVYIGRFLRFHSWHALSKPHDLVAELGQHFFDPAVSPIAWPFTLGVFGLLCGIHYSLGAFSRAAAAAAAAAEG